MKLEMNDNKLLHGAILKALPAGFLNALLITFGMMVDMILAGSMFDGSHIACIGLVMPLFMFLSSLLDIFSNGSLVLLAKNIGMGDTEGGNRMYSISIELSVAIGIFLSAATFVFAPYIVVVLGARTPEIASLTTQYLRGLSPMFTFGSLGIFMSRILGIYSLHGESVILGIINMAVNAGASYALVAFTEIGIAGLALGSAVASIVTVFAVLVVLKIKKAGCKFSFTRFKFKETAEMAKLGFAESGDRLAESISSGIINNILVSGIGIVAVATYSVVRSIYNLVLCAIRAADMGATPLFGLLYGARDRNGISRVARSAFGIGVTFTVLWCVVVMLLMPIWFGLYGVTPEKGLDGEIVRLGVMVMTAFCPIAYFNRLLTAVYQSTEQAGKSAVNAIIADSLIFPAILFVLVPLIGYMGIWLSYGISYIVFYIIAWVIMTVKNKKPIYTVEDILSLPQSVRDNVPKLDISIHNRSESIVGISREIQSFLEGEGIADRRAYAAALSLEEIAVDFVENSGLSQKHMMFDIKLFVDEGEKISINVRCAGKRYDPLDFEYDDNTFKKIGVRMIKKIAADIRYDYIYKLNVINIAL